MKVLLVLFNTVYEMHKLVYRTACGGNNILNQYLVLFASIYSHDVIHIIRLWSNFGSCNDFAQILDCIKN